MNKINFRLDSLRSKQQKVVNTAHPTWGTLLSYAVATKLQCNALYWAKVHPAELHSTLLSYAEPYWATLYPTKLRTTMWATLQPNWATFSTRTFVQFCQMPECRTVHVQYRKSGTSVHQSGTGMLKYRTEMTDARLPMPVASASMPMPSYAD